MPPFCQVTLKLITLKLRYMIVSFLSHLRCFWLIAFKAAFYPYYMSFQFFDQAFIYYRLSAIYENGVGDAIRLLTRDIGAWRNSAEIQ